MKCIQLILIALMFAVIFPVNAEVQSLRGDNKITSSSNKAIHHKQMIVDGGFKKNYVGQPPLIPHNIEKYNISLRNNGCLTCHAQDAYQKEHSTMVSGTHYFTRDWTMLDSVSKRRFFCLQCHVTQVQSKELISNTYQAAEE